MNSTSSCHHTEQPRYWPFLVPRRDGSLPRIWNQCGFCIDRSVEWADCSMHNPATESQTAKDFDTMHKSAQSLKPCDPNPPTHHSVSPPQRERKSHCITLTTPVITIVVALAATLTVAHPVVIGITMTVTVVVPLVLVTTPLSGIMISQQALLNPFLLQNWQIPP